MDIAFFLFVFIVTCVAINVIWQHLNLNIQHTGTAADHQPKDLLQRIHHFVQTSALLEKALSKHELYLLRDREPYLKWNFFDHQNQTQTQNENENENENTIAFTENKTSVHVCLDSSDSSDSFDVSNTNKRKINALVYIILHELAHVATDLNEETHGPQFYERFAKITRAAQRDGLYQLDDYAKRPLNYCGRTLKHQVLSD